jgi:hypothetical protein
MKRGACALARSRRPFRTIQARPKDLPVPFPERAVSCHSGFRGGANARRETASIHHAARRRGGGVAACCARADVAERSGAHHLPNRCRWGYRRDRSYCRRPIIGNVGSAALSHFAVLKDKMPSANSAGSSSIWRGSPMQQVGSKMMFHSRRIPARLPGPVEAWILESGTE